MLRREGDGVRWWFEHNALSGADPEVLALPTLAVRFVSNCAPDVVVHRVRELVGAVEDLDVFSTVGAVRQVANGYFDGFDHDAGPWDPVRFERIAARVAEPDGHGMDLDWEATAGIPDRPETWFWQDGLALAVHAENRYATMLCWEWSLHASTGLYRGDALDAAAWAWSALLEQVGTWPEVCWGAVFQDHNYSYSSEQTPFEAYFSKQADPRGSDRQVRGYYWANLLTEGHIERYGGLAALLDVGERAGVECRQVTGREAVLVRCTRPVSEFDDAQLAMMRDVLDPVLPEVSYRYYGGPPLRVLKEPGTAFRRIPPEIEIPWFDDDPPLKPNSGTARQLVPDE